MPVQASSSPLLDKAGVKLSTPTVKRRRRVSEACRLARSSAWVDWAEFSCLAVHITRDKQ